MRASSAAAALIGFQNMPTTGACKKAPARDAQKRRRARGPPSADRLRSLTSEVYDQVDERIPAQRVIHIRVGVAVAENPADVSQRAQGWRLVEHVVDARRVVTCPAKV